ncbi:MAG: hypothetical protein KGS60_19560 [Verrucomicrobia bacterium]|nr:hypothetical protein [Verrucomicrobiota bacterium]
MNRRERGLAQLHLEIGPGQQAAGLEIELYLRIGHDGRVVGAVPGDGDADLGEDRGEVRVEFVMAGGHDSPAEPVNLSDFVAQRGDAEASGRSSPFFACRQGLVLIMLQSPDACHE